MTNNSVCRCLGFMAALGFRCWHAEDVVRCLADLGYGAVGWIMDHLHPGRSPDDLADLVRIPERYGVIASEAGVQPDFVTLDPSTYEEPVQSVAVSIPAAARAGINGRQSLHRCGALESKRATVGRRHQRGTGVGTGAESIRESALSGRAASRLLGRQYGPVSLQAL